MLVRAERPSVHAQGLQHKQKKKREREKEERGQIIPKWIVADTVEIPTHSEARRPTPLHGQWPRRALCSYRPARRSAAPATTRPRANRDVTLHFGFIRHAGVRRWHGRTYQHLSLSVGRPSTSSRGMSAIDPLTAPGRNLYDVLCEIDGAVGSLYGLSSLAKEATIFSQIEE